MQTSGIVVRFLPVDTRELIVDQFSRRAEAVTSALPESRLVKLQRSRVLRNGPYRAPVEAWRARGLNFDSDDEVGSGRVRLVRKNLVSDLLEVEF